ncbi:tRNA (adenosine(37)-N6)-threonylcarbamoyltransferase complex transferase subunit TsaD [Candidatus Falkowbacteria bacterium]|nr:tRNA (adenosine(37)-N6)-threonylcarbamoyltransferase complex transferase subunit TsaD [Candidatus Falkowbacteria bacterium]
MTTNASHKLILAIETSCDETAAALIDFSDGKITVKSNVINSQIKLHQKYGGVVPELAAREHVKNIVPVIHECLKDGNIKTSEAKNIITAIAVAAGPGLVTSLVVGVETAKALSLAWETPLIPINHIEAHIFANFISNESINLPAIILTVSGGHTNLMKLDPTYRLEMVGQTRDDAAGEAFDKAAQLMNLGYPGGPIVSRLAKEFLMTSGANNIKLPRPMIETQNFDFSFSGLKTALLYQLQKDKDWQKRIPQYCAEFQQAVIDVLVFKTMKAAKKFSIGTVMLAGGVSANAELRTQLKASCEKAGLSFHMPELQYTTDNAAMIGAAACFRQETGLHNIIAKPNLEI